MLWIFECQNHNEMNIHSHSAQSDEGLIFKVNPRTKKIVFTGCIILCLTPFVSPTVALLLGFAVAQFTGHPYMALNHKGTSLLLQFSVVGLGFGMNVHSALQAGKEGIIFTLFSIIGTLVMGYFIGKWLCIDKKTAYLVSSGTAICGGSAIAAISPVILAGEKQVSVALGCIFIFNALALLVFPLVGHYLNLSQSQFGLWCAIAIHDTSSVVGAASKFGAKALEVATTVKLARALWIIPVAFLSTFLFKNPSKKISFPYFIILFVLAIVVNTYLPAIAAWRPYLISVAKAGLTLTLFLIGAGLSRKILLAVGFKPLLQGLLLWIMVSLTALYAVMHLA